MPILVGTVPGLCHFVRKIAASWSEAAAAAAGDGSNGGGEAQQKRRESLRADQLRPNMQRDASERSCALYENEGRIFSKPALLINGRHARARACLRLVFLIVYFSFSLF